MTFPRQTRDLLMFPPSFSLMPSAPVALARSLCVCVCVCVGGGGGGGGGLKWVTMLFKNDHCTNLPARSTRFILLTVSHGRSAEYVAWWR